jgi:four helix bundle protein
MSFVIPEDPPEVVFPFERLHAYQAACIFLQMIDPLVRDRKCGNAEMRDQLHRAALSVKLNLAEGSTEFNPTEKTRFFRIASRSAGEAASALGEFSRWGLIDERFHRKGRYCMNAAISMITGLIKTIEA